MPKNLTNLYSRIVIGGVSLMLSVIMIVGGIALFSHAETPTPEGAAVRFIGADSGNTFSVALDSDGNVWSFGANTYGQHGNGTTTGSNIPVMIPEASFGVGAEHVKIVEISAGSSYVLALDELGRLWSWGRETLGRTGDGKVPAAINAVWFGNKKVKKFSTGNDHALAITEDGRLYAWGSGVRGKLGDGTTDDSTFPIEISLSKFSGASTIKKVAAGGYFSLAIDNLNRVWAWGGNWRGPIGNGTSGSMGVLNPTLISNGTRFNGMGIVAITAGGNSIQSNMGHSMAIDTSGNVWTWGANEQGQLGNGGTSTGAITTPGKRTFNGNPQLQQILASGTEASLALDTQNRLWTWGAVYNGQLGEYTSRRTTPALISNGTRFNGKKIMKVAAGDYTCFAIDEDGSLWAWGRNAEGQTGTGDAAETVWEPLLVTAESPGTSITFNTNGGSTVATAKIPVDETNLAAYKPANPTRTGYDFVDWYKESTLENVFDFDTETVPTSNITLYAKWTPLSISITYNMNGHGLAPLLPLQHVYDTPTSLVDIKPREIPAGKKFVGWSLTDGGPIITEIPGATINPQVWANWDVLTHEITFDANGGALADETDAAATIIHGNKLSAPLNDPARNCYVFNGWRTEDGNLYDFNTPVESSFTLFAHWDGVIYTADYHFNGGSHPSYTKGFITFGEQFNLAIPTRELHKFDGWFSADGQTQYTDNAGEGFTIWEEELENGSIDVYAHWTKTGFVITFITGTNEVSVNSVIASVDSNMSELAPSTPERTGYTFKQWSAESGSEYDFEIENPPTTDITLNAEWTANEYTVVYNFNGGSHEKETDSVTWGDTYTLVVPKLNHHTFLGWFDFDGKRITNAAGRSESDTWNTDINNYDLYAHWETVQYEMRFDFNDGITPWTTITHTYNRLIPAEFIPTVSKRDFATFQGWFTSEGKEFNFETMLMPANGIALTARWTVNLARLEKLVSDLSDYVEIDGFEETPFQNFLDAMANAKDVLDASDSTIEGAKTAHDELLAAAVALTIADDDGVVTPINEFNLPTTSDNTWIFILLGCIIVITISALVVWQIMMKRKEKES